MHRLPQFADDRQARLAVADHEQVDERGEQLGVLRARAAGDHQRVVGPAILGVECDAARGRASSGRWCSRSRTGARNRGRRTAIKRSERLQAVERQAVLAEGGLEVGQGREDALAGPVVARSSGCRGLEARGGSFPARRCRGTPGRRSRGPSRWSLATLFSSPPMYCAGVLMSGKMWETTWFFSDWFNIDRDSAIVTALLQGHWLHLIAGRWG